MKSLFYVFVVTFVSYVSAFPEEIRALRQKLNETLDKDDFVHNQLHQIELRLIMLNVEEKRHKCNPTGAGNTDGNQISVDDEDSIGSKILEEKGQLESEKAMLKEELRKLDEKKNKLKRKLKVKSSEYFKVEMLIGGGLWFLGYLGLLILFLMFPDSCEGDYLPVRAAYKSFVGFVGVTFVRTLGSYFKWTNKMKSM